jgi:hypothetical protein
MKERLAAFGCGPFFLQDWSGEWALTLQFLWSFSMLFVRNVLFFSAVLSLLTAHVLCIRLLIPESVQFICSLHVPCLVREMDTECKE